MYNMREESIGLQEPVSRSWGLHKRKLPFTAIYTVKLSIISNLLYMMTWKYACINSCKITETWYEQVQ